MRGKDAVNKDKLIWQLKVELESLHKLKFYPSVLLLVIKMTQSAGEKLDSYCKNYYHLLFWLAVPSVAPRITSLTANYTAIRVAWAPIPQEHVKGILRGYYIIYWKIPRVSHDNSIIQVNQSTLSVVIVGLKQNTTYGVRLTGFTRIRGWIRNGVLGRVHNITTKHGEKIILPSEFIPVTFIVVPI